MKRKKLLAVLAAAVLILLAALSASAAGKEDLIGEWKVTAVNHGDPAGT